MPDAQASPDMGIIAATLVAMGVAGLNPIEHAHHAATSAAADQPCQQSFAATSGLAGGALLHMSALLGTCADSLQTRSR